MAEDLNVDGLTFTPIRGKDAIYKGWTTNALSFEEATEKYLESNGYYTGIGLVHSTSNTCCLDIDDIDGARSWFRTKYGIDDLMTYLDGHFEVLSPKAESGKFMFRLPPNVVLQKFVITECKLEFRTGSHQDAWPGSAHPEDGWTSREKGGIKSDGLYSHKGSDKLLDLPLELLKIWQENQTPVIAKSDGRVVRINGQTIDEIVEGIITGKLIHPNMIDYSYGQIRDGVAPSIVKATLRGLLAACQNLPDMDQKRWQTRYDSIDITVDGAIERINKEDEGDTGTKKLLSDDEIKEGAKDDEINFREIPWPPGRMGELATAALNYQRYQYPELAVVSAVGLIASVCGRKFDISHPATGLNVYMTVLGPTGIGKGSIEKFINQVLFNSSGIGRDISFVGNNDFTSGTVLMKSLENARCQISITDEAGQSLSSKSGDPQKKTLTLLDLHSKSGSEDWTMNQGQRDKEFSTKKLKGVAFSWINISTPEVFKKEFYQQGSVSNGLAPRMSIYSIDRIALERNKKPHLTLSSNLMDRLMYLIEVCSKIQAVDQYEAWHFELHPDIEDEADELEIHYRELMSTLRDNDVNKADMHNRAYLKVLRFAGLATALNKTKNDKDSLIITREEWDWAKSMVEYEMANNDMFFSGSYFGDSLHEGIQIVRKTVFKLLSGDYEIKDKFGNLTPKQRQMQNIPRTALYRRLKNNSTLKELNDDPKFKSKPISGLDKCINAMVDGGELKASSDNLGKAQKVYKVVELH